MKDRKKRAVFKAIPISVTWTFVFWCTLFLVFFAGLIYSSFRLYFRGFKPGLVSSWRPSMISGVSPAITVIESVLLPDEMVTFLKYPPSIPMYTKYDFDCNYLAPNSSPSSSSSTSSSSQFHHHGLKKSPESVEDDNYLRQQVVRCPLVKPRGMVTSLSVKLTGYTLPVGPTRRWTSLAYDAVIDRDNTTVVFVKGFKLRGGRQSDPSKFKCVYGFDLSKYPKLVLQSDVVSIAQEIVRCETPLSILNNPQSINGGNVNNSMMVSVRMVGKKPVESIARPNRRIQPGPIDRKQHQMCVCTMLRNQASSLREWIMYHTRIGVQRWFIYDNNSLDDIENVIEELSLDSNINVTRHFWPWIKTQEAGFAHCALRARDVCDWVGFMDVDEFFNLRSGLSLTDMLRNQSSNPDSNVAELRVSCYNFGPSGLKQVPAQGVIVGYNCRMILPERHKSIVKTEALNSTLINVVHHFHLKSGFRYVNMDRNVMVINHYKYQVWEVFKQKFYRRVATYVSDWNQHRNVGSKDRTPGLGTKAIEPPDWSSRFCEVIDTGLKDRVRRMFTNPDTGKLPWQNH